VIAHGETGRLFASRELDSLAAAMRSLRDDPRERQRLGAAARAAVAQYHPDAVARQLEEVYERVLGERG
jgi:glycosyltransferase involved in cell wall biosynthesis